MLQLKYYVSKFEDGIFKVDFSKPSIKCYEFVISGISEKIFSQEEIFKNIQLDKISQENFYDYIFSVNEAITDFFKNNFKYYTSTDVDYKKLLRINFINKQQRTINGSNTINGLRDGDYVNLDLLIDLAN